MAIPCLPAVGVFCGSSCCYGVGFTDEWRFPAYGICKELRERPFKRGFFQAYSILLFPPAALPAAMGWGLRMCAAQVPACHAAMGAVCGSMAEAAIMGAVCGAMADADGYGASLPPFFFFALCKPRLNVRNASIDQILLTDTDESPEPPSPQSGTGKRARGKPRMLNAEKARRVVVNLLDHVSGKERKKKGGEGRRAGMFCVYFASPVSKLEMRQSTRYC